MKERWVTNTILAIQVLTLAVVSWACLGGEASAGEEVSATPSSTLIDGSLARESLQLILQACVDTNGDYECSVAEMSANPVSGFEALVLVPDSAEQMKTVYMKTKKDGKVDQALEVKQGLRVEEVEARSMSTAVATENGPLCQPVAYFLLETAQSEGLINRLTVTYALQLCEEDG